ncbi:universal stress protein in QAH/OAS sulfhydrylase 3'region-like [Xenia sp. Carnegie-2017]|uniref:universal stress protein in QAH/OAS sulfhydrylase 3'region-like n=1 Tax=Xenia sp. Carnegie-2017 TaxID=2897299 RepID=UPI001F0376A6|nr:universal stress protein in QAH/OAS sulfhydrylase 3'region-like [Xenia sp. Carnegie-2017]
MSFKVLIPVDGSENSEKAYDCKVCKNMYQPSHEVIIFHAHVPPHLSTFSFKDFMHVPAEEWQQKMEASVKEVQKLENHYITKYQSKVKPKFISENCNKPGEAICKCAKAQEVDLILMGTRGLGSLRRTVLGSVSDYVLHHAERPVSVVPTH